MQLDYRFVVPGSIAVLFALFLMARAGSGKQIKPLAAAICWLLVAAGCFVQADSPNLAIGTSQGRKAFVIPPELASTTSKPDQIIARERAMKTASAILTVLGGLGLLAYYWPAIKGNSKPDGHT